MTRMPLGYKFAWLSLLICLVSCAAQGKNTPTPLDTSRLETAPLVQAAQSKSVESLDGLKLAYREYSPKQPRAVLVFYHGGGAHSGASYAHLGVALRDTYEVATIMPDIRGHGDSDGPRGDARSRRAVLKDVLTLIKHARAKHPDLPVFLGGHSSGAGLILNYSGEEALMKKSGPIAGLAFVAPQLGFRSKTEKDDAGASFAKVKVGHFVINSMSFGLLCGHCYAVRFNYAPELLERDPKLVSRNSVNMANALTPVAPRAQVRKLGPLLAIWLAQDDSLIDPDKVEAFVRRENDQAMLSVLKDEDHLSILLTAGDPLGKWIRARL